MPTREDAEDATMEVFMKVREKLGQFDASRSFSAWLYRVAANHCWDLLRRRRGRQGKENGGPETLPLGQPHPRQPHQMILRSTRPQMRRALDKLAPPARLALVF